MKILNLLLMGFIVSLVVLSSCKKEEDNDSPDGTNPNETGTFVDSRDSKEYKWVKIGEQVWMAENLAYTGGEIQQISDNDDWIANNDFDGWCYYNNNENTGNTYGVLYQSDAAKISCPNGWHLPADTEWTQLEDYLKENDYSYDGDTGSEGIGKSLASKLMWETSDVEGAVGNIDYSDYRNKTEFSALPSGGRYDFDGTFSGLTTGCSWWTDTEDEGSFYYARIMVYDDVIIHRTIKNKLNGISVRCIKD